MRLKIVALCLAAFIGGAAAGAAFFVHGAAQREQAYRAMLTIERLDGDVCMLGLHNTTEMLGRCTVVVREAEKYVKAMRAAQVVECMP